MDYEGNRFMFWVYIYVGLMLVLWVSLQLALGILLEMYNTFIGL